MNIEMHRRKRRVIIEATSAELNTLATMATLAARDGSATDDAAVILLVRNEAA